MTLTVDTEPSLQDLLGAALPALLERRGGLLAVRDVANGRWLRLSPALADL
ncbi:MAG: hypothetical protein JNK28_09430, partial [Burkholderiaceae bacterium]|nr:hypothetical protein [Burkholderiaceae bacterium]